jgi:hypothetical protein
MCQYYGSRRVQLVLKLLFHQSSRVLLSRVSDIWSYVFSEKGPIDMTPPVVSVHCFYSDLRHTNDTVNISSARACHSYLINGHMRSASSSHKQLELVVSRS